MTRRKKMNKEDKILERLKHASLFNNFILAYEPISSLL
jgi:hypothetical protein